MAATRVRKSWVWDHFDYSDRLSSQMATFHMRSSSLSTLLWDNFDNFWERAGLLLPDLAKVVEALRAVVPSEAAAERLFKRQADVHTQDRNSLARVTVACMCVGQNYYILHPPRSSAAQGYT